MSSNNQFIIKLVKMWPGGTLYVVVGTLKISLDRLNKKKGVLAECCIVSVVVSSAQSLLVKARAAERPQWPRLYSSGRPRSCDRMPSLVGDRGPVLRILGWALTRMCNISLVLGCSREAEECLCVQQGCELFSKGQRWD